MLNGISMGQDKIGQHRKERGNGGGYRLVIAERARAAWWSRGLRGCGMPARARRLALERSGSGPLCLCLCLCVWRVLTLRGGRGEEVEEVEVEEEEGYLYVVIWARCWLAARVRRDWDTNKQYGPVAGRDNYNCGGRGLPLDIYKPANAAPLPVSFSVRTVIDPIRTCEVYVNPPL